MGLWYRIQGFLGYEVRGLGYNFAAQGMGFGSLVTRFRVWGTKCGALGMRFGGYRV